MSENTKVLKRGGVPYVYDPENIEGLTEEESAVPQDTDWIEVSNGTSIRRYTWHTPVEPEAYIPPPIRLITKRSFMKRLSQPIRTAIRKSTDDIVIDIYEDLMIASNVNLDLDDVENALLYLAASGILDETTIPTILADGLESEAYRGL